MNLNVPASPGIVAGTITMATATIIDTGSSRVSQITINKLSEFVIVIKL